jgi:GxxExxY protein
MTRIILPELSYEVAGLCFKVHNELGRFCSERQYADKLEQHLKSAGVVYLREYELSNIDKVETKGNRVDFLINNSIILDVKAKKFITKEDYYQIMRYLQAANLELGLIINFRSTYLKPKRVINNNLKA